MVQLNHLHKYLGSRKGQIAIGVLLLIILGCISPTAGTVAICLLFSLGIWFGLHKLIARNGRHRSLDIAVSASPAGSGVRAHGHIRGSSMQPLICDNPEPAGEAVATMCYVILAIW